jgi:hypothetical protein
MNFTFFPHFNVETSLLFDENKMKNSKL